MGLLVLLGLKKNSLNVKKHFLIRNYKSRLLWDMCSLLRVVLFLSLDRSTKPHISPSRRRNRVSLALLDESACLSWSLNDRLNQSASLSVDTSSLSVDSSFLWFSSTTPPLFLDLSSTMNRSVALLEGGKPLSLSLLTAHLY